jgi:hypothetical protein
MDISLILFLFTERYNVICVIICIIHNNVNRTNILFSEISLTTKILLIALKVNLDSYKVLVDSFTLNYITI